MQESQVATLHATTRLVGPMASKLANIAILRECVSESRSMTCHTYAFEGRLLIKRTNFIAEFATHTHSIMPLVEHRRTRGKHDLDQSHKSARNASCWFNSGSHTQPESDQRPHQPKPPGLEPVRHQNQREQQHPPIQSPASRLPQ